MAQRKPVGQSICRWIGAATEVEALTGEAWKQVARLRSPDKGQKCKSHRQSHLAERS